MHGGGSWHASRDPAKGGAGDTNGEQKGVYFSVRHAAQTGQWRHRFKHEQRESDAYFHQVEEGVVRDCEECLRMLLQSPRCCAHLIVEMHYELVEVLLIEISNSESLEKSMHELRQALIII